MDRSSDSKHGGVTALTPRERDCLRLMANGLRTADVTAELAISRPTLNAHLSAARRKLGAATTAHAMLILAREAMGTRHNAVVPFSSHIAWFKDLSPNQITFLDRLTQASSLTESWQILVDHVASIGITSVLLGFLTNPDGIVDESDYYFRSSLPQEVLDLYQLIGGPRHDPIIPYVARGGAPLLRDSEWYRTQLRQQSTTLPPDVIRFGESLISHHLDNTLCVRLRDSVTGAPFCLVFGFAHMPSRTVVATVSHHERDLIQTALLFWEHVQHKRMLSSLPRLTTRQREALMLVVRGFTVREMAERMHASQRSAEKFLAGARLKLGARNNAQAVFRAMVYRAIA